MIAKLESRILTLIDGMVDCASDDELLANGYLRGHLTLTITGLEGGDDRSTRAVHTIVSQSLKKAIGAGGLSLRDQALVTDMWGHLFQQASQQQVATSGVPCLIQRLSRLIRPTGNAQVGQGVYAASDKQCQSRLPHLSRFTFQQLPHP